MKEVCIFLLQYTPKQPSRLPPFWRTHLGRTSTHSKAIQYKNTQQHTKNQLSKCLLSTMSRWSLIPPPNLSSTLSQKTWTKNPHSEGPTQCNGQIASHTTTYPNWYIILGDLVPSIQIISPRLPFRNAYLVEWINSVDSTTYHKQNTPLEDLAHSLLLWELD